MIIVCALGQDNIESYSASPSRAGELLQLFTDELLGLF